MQKCAQVCTIVYTCVHQPSVGGFTTVFLRVFVIFDSFLHFFDFFEKAQFLQKFNEFSVYQFLPFFEVDDVVCDYFSSKTVEKWSIF